MYRNELSTDRSRSSWSTCTRSTSRGVRSLPSTSTPRRPSGDWSAATGRPSSSPGRNTAVLNMTHIPAPLDPVEASAAQLDGREQADRVVEFLRAEFPKAFGQAKVRSYGLPGRRQTRWIKGSHQLSLDEVRAARPRTHDRPGPRLARAGHRNRQTGGR
ncbi:FAD-dependent oxidoreductase [Streptomyces sp900116325]|uniref:FAD-dependent oxidoreductase n=1 Tax=Streptomyces sp. 900116325 TaxID=3154295 RepID=UPI0033ACD508